MGQEQDPAALARAIIDSTLYMVLGTADPAGRPWVSPVYYATAGYREFFWVSAPDARHSRNIEARSDLSIVIFDSSVPIDTGNGVYMAAVGQELVGGEHEEGISLFSQRSLSHGGRPWTLTDVEAPARLRFYRATVTEHYILEADTDRRLPVTV